MVNEWKKFKSDVNSMTDEEIEKSIEESQYVIQLYQEWLDAVQSWKDAGKPRG